MTDIKEIMADALLQEMFGGAAMGDAETKRQFERVVSASIQALDAAGYQIMPVEPTEKMLDILIAYGPTYTAMWKAMMKDLFAAFKEEQNDE